MSKARASSIDTKDLPMMNAYLSVYRREVEAFEFLDGITLQFSEQQTHASACYAWSIVKQQVRKTVEAITIRGGLLLIGGRA